MSVVWCIQHNNTAIIIMFLRLKKPNLVLNNWCTERADVFHQDLVLQYSFLSLKYWFGKTAIILFVNLSWRKYVTHWQRKNALKFTLIWKKLLMIWCMLQVIKWNRNILWYGTYKIFKMDIISYKAVWNKLIILINSKVIMIEKINICSSNNIY